MAEVDDWTGSGSATAFTRLFLAHHRRLVAMAGDLVGDDEAAREVVRGAFLALDRRRRLLRDPSVAVARLEEWTVEGARRHPRARPASPPATPAGRDPDEVGSTDTGSELQDLLVLCAASRNRRLQTSAVGGLAAAVLVVSALVLRPVDPAPDPSTLPVVPPRSRAPMNADERLAHDFATTYFAYDRRRAASYVVDGVTPTLRLAMGEGGWLRQNRLDEALGTRFRVDACYQIGTLSPQGARIGCLYTIDFLGLSGLGRGPFSGNLFAVAVEDGRVVDFVTAVGANDYDELGWGPFWSWVEHTRAADVPALERLEEPDLAPSEVTRALRLWRRLGREYVASLRSGEVT